MSHGEELHFCCHLWLIIYAFFHYSGRSASYNEGKSWLKIQHSQAEEIISLNSVSYRGFLCVPQSCYTKQILFNQHCQTKLFPVY